MPKAICNESDARGRENCSSATTICTPSHRKADRIYQNSMSGAIQVPPLPMTTITDPLIDLKHRKRRWRRDPASCPQGGPANHQSRTSPSYRIALAAVLLLGARGQSLDHTIRDPINGVGGWLRPQELCRRVPHVGLHPARVEQVAVKPFALGSDPHTVQVDHGLGCPVHGLWYRQLAPWHLLDELRLRRHRSALNLKSRLWIP
ncbi:hypothetical protein GGR56DRAFT_631211 [Xylariaceae sp. FL0804]|nr:hypothetical protein GGR56DRAFT_631211 [Xylariaceae sp. FL0804]